MNTSKTVSETITACRSCGSSDLHPFLDLGVTPLADRLPSEGQLDQEDLMVPLAVVLCGSCSLVQITETVEPEELFCRDYPYYSSVSPALMRYFGDSARAIIDSRPLGANSLVMEAASNDGYMLRHFVEAGIPVLGIDPAEGQAIAAREKGVDTLNTFFGLELARELAGQGKQADVFLANNVLAHVADLRGFVEGISLLLKQDGVAVIECPYLMRLIEHCEFDTIYHQHLCYYSVHALVALFEQFGLHLNDLLETEIHGGSLRLFVSKTAGASAKVEELLEQERAAGATELAFFQTFSDRVAGLKRDLVGLLERLRAEGKKIVGYGAPAKGCTMMAYCGIDSSHLDYLVDLNPVKHGRYMGGNRLRIEPTERLREDQPDYALILPWNFSREIMEQQAEWISRGGRFIVPVPQVEVLPR